MRDNKGITMIILVVAVIILIILASVGINTLVGKEGILEKEKQVVGEYENEAENLASKQLTSFSSSSVAITKPTNTSTGSSGTVKIKFKDGTESTIGENESLKSDYQKIVHTSFFSSNENNVQSGEATWEWQLFYDDDEYIFLIASDYVPISTLPAYGNPGFTEQDGNLLPTNKVNEKYNAAFCSNSNYNDYVLASGTAYKSGSAATPLTSNPLTSKYLKWVDLNSSSKNTNIQCVAFMMDRDKWSQYAGNKYTGAFAIGGPTQELFEKSWNAYDSNTKKFTTHDTMTSGTNYNTKGYYTKFGNHSWDIWSGADKDLGNSTTMWVIQRISKAYECWVAAPSASGTDNLVRVSCNSDLSSMDPCADYSGFRPVVVIPKASIKGTSSVTASDYKHPYIPTGFTHTEGEWNSGYTIKNSTTNDEFVWVPCTLEATSETVAFAKVFPTTPITNFNTTDEVYSSDPNYMYNKNKYTDFTDQSGAKADIIRTSVGKYGGFYIAKYEASELDGKAKSVPNASAWVNMSRADAVIYSEAMVNTTDGVKSALISGECWDTTLQWMVTKSDNATSNLGYDTDSTGKGWYKINSKKTTGTPLDSTNANKVNNIWDMAGNISEWTTENCKSSNNIVMVERGGCYTNASGKFCPAANRGVYNSNNGESIGSIGFRVVLYKQ